MMKLKTKKYFTLCLVISVCMLSGCIEEFEADIPDDDTNLLVVEGTISSGKMNTFILSRTLSVNSSRWWNDIGLGGDTSQAGNVNHATVSVKGSDGSEYMTEELYYGKYTCMIDTLYPDVEYYLHIEIDNEVYESEPQKPLPTEKIADVSGVQYTPESNIDILVTPQAPFEPDRPNYYSWTYDETWEVHPDYVTEWYYDIESRSPVYIIGYRLFPERGWKDAKSSTIMIGASTTYEGQHIKGLKMYDIGRSNERIYYRYSGLIHQRAISKAEYEYETTRRQVATEMGGLFSPQPSSLPTNIHCLTSNKRAIGFIGCSLNTSEYRFFLNAMEYSIHHPSLPDTRFWKDDPTEEDCCRLVNIGMYLCEWQYGGETGSTLQTAWAWLYQLDVREKGAYIEKPDFWSLTENVSY